MRSSPSLSILAFLVAEVFSAYGNGEDCQSVWDEFAYTDDASWVSGVGVYTDACDSGFCLDSMITRTDYPICGSFGSNYGDGCETDEDCWNGMGKNGSKCFDGECKIPNGNVCSMATYFGDYVLTSTGGAYDGCQSGWCLADNIVRNEPVCGTYMDHGTGCTSDDDCWVGEGNHGSKCFDGKCKIPNGNVCSMSDAYDMTPNGGYYEGCQSGWCLNSNIVRAEPVCGTFISYGSGCLS